ncbi:MAG: DUF169 domain-containing protein [Thermodesulfobacteriota bacterium]|nr:DUF169 domain-containing protein [Thermodesulfobacteriota bacterium]
MNLTDFQQLGKELYEKLHLPTYPVAITYIKSEDEIPVKAMRPSAMGQKMCICQTFTYARSWGAHVAITAEENFCVPGSAGPSCRNKGYCGHIRLSMPGLQKTLRPEELVALAQKRGVL